MEEDFDIDALLAETETDTHFAEILRSPGHSNEESSLEQDPEMLFSDLLNSDDPAATSEIAVEPEEVLPEAEIEESNDDDVVAKDLIIEESEIAVTAVQLSSAMPEAEIKKKKKAVAKPSPSPSWASTAKISSLTADTKDLLLDKTLSSVTLKVHSLICSGSRNVLDSVFKNKTSSSSITSPTSRSAAVNNSTTNNNGINDNADSEVKIMMCRGETVHYLLLPLT